jgi:hypothetical protein
MKINFTKSEYRLLIEIVEIAEWVLHSHRTQEPEGTKKYSILIQKILSYAKEMGFEDLIAYDSQLGGYYATKQFEDESDHMGYIDEFEDDVFWDALAHRLAVRDLVTQVGKAEYENMEFSERASKLLELAGWYNEEFIENGLVNVKVDTSKSNKIN